MRLVRQNDGKCAERVCVRAGLVVLAVAALASAGCAGGLRSPVSPVGSPGANAAEAGGEAGGAAMGEDVTGQGVAGLGVGAGEHEAARDGATAGDGTAARDGAGAGRGGRPGALEAPSARALDRYATQLRHSYALRAAAARRWGLTRVPLTPPAPPARKPEIRTRKGFEVARHRAAGLPPVFTTVPTPHRVVFLTVDDGAEKDPAFLRMTTELQIPYTAFLTDYLVREDYGYFTRMQELGVTLDNHTLNHRYLPRLSYAAQKREICGMQDVIEDRFGTRPKLFRPPYGSYNRNTLRAAASCGIEAVPLWNAEVFAHKWEYRDGEGELRPGDIVLTHFRGRSDGKGTMQDMLRRFLGTVTEKGYAVARLEDYL